MSIELLFGLILAFGVLCGSWIMFKEHGLIGAILAIIFMAVIIFGR